MSGIRKQYYRFKHLYYSYVNFLIRYFSFRKLLNLGLNTYEFLTKKAVIESVPPIVHIDVCNSCILHCPLCATGKGDKSQTKATMKFEQFKEIFDKVKNYVFFIWLYNWGEPFLCKDIFKIVDYCHKNNVGVKIDSNLNYYNDEILKNIVKSKIDYISLSIDGFTQKNYQFYRRNGDLKKVFIGIKKIQEFKRNLRSKFPILIWQFLINNQNINEVGPAYLWSKENKVDIFEARPLSLFTDVDSKFESEEYGKFLSDTGVPEKAARRGKNPGHCRYLWNSFAVNPNNSFSPCPVIYKDNDTFGSFKKKEAKNLREIVNSKVFIESRNLFKIPDYKTKIHTPCLRCNWYTKP